MHFIKSLLTGLVNIFFKVYFGIVGEPNIEKTLSKTIDLYKGEGFIQEFASIRVWDAPFAEINALVPQKGKVVDLGCGDGILTNYLALTSRNRSLVGIEKNKDRLSDADKGLNNTKFEKGDIVKGKYPKSDCIVLSHVLHHLPNKKAQEKVIAETVKKLNKNGKLIVVEIAEKPIQKLIFTWLTDAFTVPIIFEKKPFDFSFRYRTIKQWEHLLRKTGYQVQYELAHKGKPFSHVIFDCKR